jgi:hypothetical protein
VASAFIPVRDAPRPTRVVSCPPGYERSERSELGPDGYCVPVKRPEPFTEIAGLLQEWGAKVAAPAPYLLPGAYRAALEQRSEMIRSAPKVPGTGGRWVPYGRGPLIANDPRFPHVTGFGFVYLNGRVDSLDYDPMGHRLFALVGTGGVWMSKDLGLSWRSIGDRLPSQINGALAWSRANGGTLITVSGEHLMGGNTYTGVGAFWTSDLGKTWHQARGVPDGALGFQVAVDPTNPREVYVATSKGLYRSTDAGHSYVNVRLPTGECAGRTDNQRCIFANFVTDVVVQSPDQFGNKGGTVLAAVGWRAGQRTFPNSNVVQAPANGLYRSATGKPRSFTKLPAPGFTPQARIGRIELGVAAGPRQDHGYVYAIVQDAEKLNGGVPFIDAPENEITSIPNGTVLNGIYASSDFGGTWTKMADDIQIANNPLAGSALFPLFPINGPGIQAWYNMWIKPDPTRQFGDGVPTRVSFGLEEVWQNRVTVLPQDGLSDFRVIGRYYATDTCIVSAPPVPTCPSVHPLAPTTTHPDQHDAIWVPDGAGGVTLFVGNDGGVHAQHVGPGEEFDNTKWGTGLNFGFNTLLPYDAAMAKDGTVWFGLQDNGSGKIDPRTRQQFMTYGGDGFFVAVDPDNSNVAYSETTLGTMRVTTDGGRTWRNLSPPITSAKFSNPFVMDPKDANHLMTAGREVVETVSGPRTGAMGGGDWAQVFDLGTVRGSGGPVDNSMSALDVHGDAAYVGFCGVCDRINTADPFLNGLATNVGGDEPPRRMTSKGWHKAKAKGLPNQYITSIAIDPKRPRTVYVTMGGYANRQWYPPGAYGDTNRRLGDGHVFKSTDAGEHFVDISGSLPDVPHFWVELRGGQLVVGTQIGVFLSKDSNGSSWAALDRGLPVAPISTLRIAPQDRNLLVAAIFGRGVYTYRFSKS